MKANSDKSKQSNKATRRVLAGVLCGASVLSLVLSLVMPPISQAIANDAQTVSTEETVMGGGSSSESTDVENTNNGDTDNQNSDDAEGGETGDDVQSEGLSEEDSQDEDAEQTADDASNEGAIPPVAEDATEYTLINSADDLSHYLQNDKKAGKYRLNLDIEYASDITLGQGETTIDLNGHKIKHSGVEPGKSPNMSMFNVPEGATLTIEDLQQAADNKFEQDGDKNGNLAKLDYDGTTPSKLTYYVTDSTSSATATTETLFKHEVAINGAIVGTTAHSTMRLINVCGGTFNLQSGVLTTNQDANVRHLIYADNGSTVSMSGGYVCGASMGSDGAGAGIHVEGSTLDEGSTLEISGGVIAGNYAPSGGGVYARNSTVHMVGGIISGNGTNNSQSGFGAGICAENSNVAITDGHITNNKYQHYDDSHKGNGCHGGGGIAAFNGGSLAIAGGYITGNYSAEAGGGVYAGAWNSALSGFTFSGGTIASNVAQNSEGGGIRISAPTVGDFNVSDKKAYITNNTTNTTNDWGGGGVFVQGSSEQGIKSASLNIYNALITNNHANGFGGGFAACPTGKTAITDTNGIAVFGNSDGNSDGGYNRSGGTHEKTDDKDWLPNNKGGEITEDFKNAGHKDLFLIRDSTNSEYIAAVTGQMLGGGAASWSGTIDGHTATIGKYDGAQARYMIGLRSDSSVDDQNVAKGLASLYITGNESNVHGGGIMTNGNVVAGSTTRVSVYPKMKLNGIKKLTGRALYAGEFKFQLLKPGKGGKAPSFNDGKLQLNDCSAVDTVENDENGKFTFDLGEVYADDDLVYYLVEVPGTDKDVAYDKTIYKIDPEIVKDEEKSHDVLDIKYTYYKVRSVSVTKVKNDGAGARTSETESATIAATEGENAVNFALTSGATFTNKCPSRSWTPNATKVVEGGEMKEFTLQLAKDSKFQDIIGTAVTTSGKDTKQTLLFKDTTDKNKKVELKYSLSDIRNNPDDPDGSTGGPFKTFTYYVREETDGSQFSHYTYDHSVYKFTVVPTYDTEKGEINCKVTYKKGIVDSKGDWTADPKAEERTFIDTSTPNSTPISTPTFTNTYSTSLPLSGMSGVTLTYLAGAAVLCAAAAWMHIRRKANAKGGKRRE